MNNFIRTLSVLTLALLGLAPMAQAAPITASAVVDGTGTPGIEAFTVANASKPGASFDRVTVDLSSVAAPGQAFDPARGPFTVQGSSIGLTAPDVTASFSGPPSGAAAPGLSELLTLDFPGGQFTPGNSLVFTVGTDQLGQAGPSQTPISLAGAKVTVASGPDSASGTLAPSGRALALINSAALPTTTSGEGPGGTPGVIESPAAPGGSTSVPEPASLLIWSTLGLLGWRTRRRSRAA